MTDLILFKALQRKLKFRNSKNRLHPPTSSEFSSAELLSARLYCERRLKAGVGLTAPGCAHYPMAFYKMKEPPLFLEYKGAPVWETQRMISVVGSRDLHPLSQHWIETHLPVFLNHSQAVVVSGGAVGVDFQAHLVALKNNYPTLVVLPSGLDNPYPARAVTTLQQLNSCRLTVLSEFESSDRIHKSHFYHRNRLIAAFGEFTLVVQTKVKSGTLLTVHHALENGKPVVVIPSHPSLLGFDGNLNLIRDGAETVSHSEDLILLWQSELKQNLDYLSYN